MRPGFFRDKAKEHIAKGREATARGDTKEARYQYLQGAEFLAKAGLASEGKLRKVWAEQARQILEIARSLTPPTSNTPAAKGPKGRKKREASEDEDAAKEDWLLREKPDVSFQDIAGLEELKERLRLRVIAPLLHPEKSREWKRPKGDKVILYGPPGCGKTMFAKAVAAELDVPFFRVKGSSIMSKWVGDSQKNVARLFKAIGEYDRAVIFMDEMDGLLSSRGSSSSVANKVVNEFLEALDGIDSADGSHLYLGATNRPWDLDEAIRSRFGAFIYVPPPDCEARLDILKRFLNDIPCDPGLDLDGIAGRLEGYSGRALKLVFLPALTERPFADSLQGTERPVTLDDAEYAFSKMSGQFDGKLLKKYKAFQSPG